MAALDRRSRHGACRAERRGHSACRQHRTEAAEPTLSFTGALDYRPNIEAVAFAARRSGRESWPPCRRRASSLPGAVRHPEVLALAGQPNVDIVARRARYGAGDLPVLGVDRSDALRRRHQEQGAGGLGLWDALLSSAGLATNGLVVPA